MILDDLVHRTKEVATASAAVVEAMETCRQACADLEKRAASLDAELQRRTAERDQWKERCQNMAAHPDVIAAKAEAERLAVSARLEQLKAEMEALKKKLGVG